MTTRINIQKTVLTGLAVAAIGAIWHSTTIAQESSSSGVVTVFNREKLEAGFSKASSLGGSAPLWSHTSSKGTYIVKTNIRDSAKDTCQPAGCSHKNFTEIMYVVSGAATMVVGGKTKATTSDKFGGQSIQGGESSRISKGDMFILPPDTPHWYKDVEMPFHYIMVTVP